MHLWRWTEYFCCSYCSCYCRFTCRFWAIACFIVKAYCRLRLIVTNSSIFDNNSATIFFLVLKCFTVDLVSKSVSLSVKEPIRLLVHSFIEQLEQLISLSQRNKEKEREREREREEDMSKCTNDVQFYSYHTHICVCLF